MILYILADILVGDVSHQVLRSLSKRRSSDESVISYLDAGKYTGEMTREYKGLSEIVVRDSSQIEVTYGGN